MALTCSRCGNWEPKTPVKAAIKAEAANAAAVKVATAAEGEHPRTSSWCGTNDGGGARK